MKRIRLSERQIDVLRLSCKSDAEIANRLGLTLNWIDKIQKNIRKKLNAHSRAECIVKAAKLRLLDIYDVEVTEDE